VLPSWLDFIRPALRVALIDKVNAQQSWLGRSGTTWSLGQSIASNDHASLVASFDKLLTARPKPKKKWMPAPASVSIILPDHVARYEMLPWTADLLLADELRQFAIERFEVINQPVRDGWAVQAEWKNRGANSLAYAVPHALLDGLHQVAHQHGLRLNHVMPISALAHYGRLGLARRNELRILHSGASASALLYRDGKLIVHLIETVRGTASDSVRRLISRLQMSELTSDLKLDRLGLVGIDPINLKQIIDVNVPKTVRTLNPLRRGEWQ
jgi:hypothetical protein